MFVLARRLTIVTLIMTIFALAFAALVAQPGRRDPGMRVGSATSCHHPAIPHCVATL
ncbi:hypothetical protein ACFFP0_20745 [Rhizobium puerariae]|uniref:Uncharacterized protein n=1 Tax=Rhizobium puerariae TaxID=1585791 RepID=A0ABV6ANI5_9HYPH